MSQKIDSFFALLRTSMSTSDLTQDKKILRPALTALLTRALNLKYFQTTFCSVL